MTFDWLAQHDDKAVVNCFCETTASASLWLYLKRLYFISSVIAYCISPYASFYAGLSCDICHRMAPLNCTRDLELLFQRQIFLNANISEMVRGCSNAPCGFYRFEYLPSNGKLRMLCAKTLTYLFKVKYLKC